VQQIEKPNAVVRQAPLKVEGLGRLAQLGMRGQPEVIVRRQVDDPLAVGRAHQHLLVIQHAQLELGATVLEVAELVGAVGKRIGASNDRHEGTS
jgi:hypothetical protein